MVVLFARYLDSTLNETHRFSTSAVTFDLLKIPFHFRLPSRNALLVETCCEIREAVIATSRIRARVVGNSHQSSSSGCTVRDYGCYGKLNTILNETHQILDGCCDLGSLRFPSDGVDSRPRGIVLLEWLDIRAGLWQTAGVLFAVLAAMAVTMRYYVKRTDVC